MLGLLLLPSDYRAGAQTAHAHALVHLWIDASDGAVLHHHVPAPVAPQGAAWDWLEPMVEVAESESVQTGDARPDIGGHHDSNPAGGSVHLLIKTVAILVLALARHVPAATPSRSPKGRAVRVLLPPPRWTSLAG